MSHTSRVVGRSRPVVAALGAYALAALFTPTAANAADAASPTTAAAAGGAQLEQIVVTARRREENVQNTPLSVSAISPTQLEQKAAPDIRDLVGATPNLIIDPVSAGPSAAAISIRGISFEDIEKSFDPSVAVLIDGVYIGTNTGQLLDFFDFSGIEVLRGPQGTLFGRNTTGGVINITRSDPTGRFGGKVSGTFGDYGRKEFRGVLNLPEVGIVDTKLFYFHKESTGYIHNVTRNADEPHSKDDNYGVTFKITPTDTFNAKLTLEGSRQRSETSQSSLSNNGDLICLALPLGPGGSLVRVTGIPDQECNRNNQKDLYTTFSNVAGPVRYRERAGTFDFNWDIGHGFTVTGVTGYRKSNESVRQDFDASSINFFDTLRVQDYHQFSQEVRVAGKITDTLDMVAGAYYFDSEYHLHQTTNWGPFLQFAAGLPAQTQAFVHHKARSEAVFADFDWKFMPKWRLSVGGRYTKDTKQIVNDATVFVARGKDSWSEFTPKVSIDYQPTDDIMLYATYAKGFRSGGFNGRASTPVAATTPYNPETVDSYEVGAKTDWLNNRLILNVAAFYTKYDNKQEEVVRPTPPGSINAQETIVSNAASATISGLEADLRARPIEGLNVTAALGLLDASYDQFQTLDPVTLTPVDLSNLNLRRTPKVTGSLGFDYTVPSQVGDWTVAADWRHIAPYDTVITPAPGTGVIVGGKLVPAVNDPRGRTNTQDLIDASLTWRQDRGDQQIHVTLFGRNLTDSRGLNGALAVAGLFSFGGPRPPRTWGVEVGYNF